VLVEVLKYPADVRAKLVKELEEKPKDLSVY
jgi:hypothetical protein